MLRYLYSSVNFIEQVRLMLVGTGTLQHEMAHFYDVTLLSHLFGIRPYVTAADFELSFVA